MNDLLLIHEMDGLGADYIAVVLTGSIGGVDLVLVLSSLVPVPGREVRAIAQEWKVVSFEGHVFCWGSYSVAGTWDRTVVIVRNSIVPFFIKTLVNTRIFPAS